MHPFFCATFRKKSLTNISKICFLVMCHLSLTPRTYWEVISDRQRTGPRESHPSEDLSELPPLRDPATRWFPNVMDYSDLKQGCGWTGVPLCPFPVMAAPVFTGCRYSLIQDRIVCKTNYDNQVGSAHHVRISWRGP